MSNIQERKKILIVDDNKTYGRLMSLFLGKHGYIVKIAETVDDAFKLLDREEFHLILSDLVMPDEDGVDFIALLHNNKSFSHLPVIIVSGYETGEHQQDLLNLGAYAVLPKSNKDTRLIETIQKALG